MGRGAAVGVRALCNAGDGHSSVQSISNVVPFVGSRFFGRADALQRHVDELVRLLSDELRLGRLFRLLCMLCTVVSSDG